MKQLIGVMVAVAVLIVFGAGSAAGETKKYYYESGKLKKEVPYSGRVKEGLAKEYYESGKVMEEIPYVKGKKHGVKKWYDESGRVTKEVPYAVGVKSGVAKYYDEKGECVRQVTYKDGLKVDSKKSKKKGRPGQKSSGTDKTSPAGPAVQ